MAPLDGVLWALSGRPELAESTRSDCGRENAMFGHSLPTLSIGRRNIHSRFRFGRIPPEARFASEAVLGYGPGAGFPCARRSLASLPQETRPSCPPGAVSARGERETRQSIAASIQWAAAQIANLGAANRDLKPGGLQGIAKTRPPPPSFTDRGRPRRPVRRVLSTWKA